MIGRGEDLARESEEREKRRVNESRKQAKEMEDDERAFAMDSLFLLLTVEEIGVRGQRNSAGNF